MKPIIITPLFNAEPNLNNLISSIKSQSQKDFKHILIDDCSTDNSYQVAVNLTAGDNRFEVIKNKEKCFALKNIIREAKKYQEDENVWVGVIDGDDEFINNKVFEIFSSAYEEGNKIVYSANKCDINGQNYRKPLPESWRNPYYDEWRYSHFRSFKSTLLKQIKEENFLGPDNSSIVRGYDRFLMIPMVYLAREKVKYINEVCYLYKLNSCSIPLNKRNYNEREQLRNVRYLYARGFIK